MPADAAAMKPRAAGGAYRWYVLLLFTTIYAFNFIDRQIVVIVAPDLKADLGLTDAQVGLLYGTAFALFYALFGLPLAKLADGWHRVRTLALGLALWSAMTAASGAARSFATLGAARIGVGIGEASAAPAAFSILQDYFPKARRATALAVYASGIYLGVGASLMIGGAVVAQWNAAFPHAAPFGLKGWQAAYLAVGLPGLLLAVLVIATVREPVRGAIDGHPHPGAPHPFRAALAELGAMVPPFSLLTLGRLGAGRAARARNLALLAGCVGGAALLVLATDGLLSPAKRVPLATLGGLAITTNLVQWSAVAAAVYMMASSIQAMRRRDSVAAALILDTPSFAALSVAGGLVSFGSYGIGGFLFVYGQARLGLDARAGLALGAIAAVAGGLGTTLGGVIGDAARRRHPAGRILVATAAATVAAGFVAWQLITPSTTLFYIADFLGIFFLTMWLGPTMAAAQDHVLPRLRGTAAAVQFLGINLIGLGLGPYWVGLVSDATGDLRLAMLSALAATPPAVVLFLFAARRIEAVETTLVDRARAAGEPV